jgi:hypothetical protein
VLIAVNVQAINPGGDPQYTPRVSVWDTDLAQLEIVNSAVTQRFCFQPDGDYWLLIPVEPNTDYYFQVTDANNLAPGADLQFQVRAAARGAVPVGTFVIPDDSDGFPTAFVDPATGDILRFIREIPAGEFGDVLANGVSCWQNGIADHGVIVLDAALATLATHDFGAFVNVVGILSDRTSTFYVALHESDGSRVIQAIGADGALGASWTLPDASKNDGAYAVARDGSVFYSGQRNLDNKPIHAYDLVNDVALADLHAGFSGDCLWGAGDGFVMEDGGIVFGYATFGGAGAGAKFRIFEPDGTVRRTITLGGGVGALNHYAFASDDDGGAVGVWGLSNPFETALAVWQVVSLADGSLAFPETSTPMAAVSGESGIEGAPFAVSNSCPLVVWPTTMASDEDDEGGGGSACVDGAITQQPNDVTVRAGTHVIVTTTWSPVASAPASAPTHSDFIVFDPNADGGGTFTERIYRGPRGDRSQPLTGVLIVTGTRSVDLGRQDVDATFWIDVTLTCAHDGHVTALESALATITINNDCECCMATKLGVINDALSKIGITRFLSQAEMDAADAGTPGSPEALLGSLHYPKALREALRAYPWPFATKYAASDDATTGDPMELVGGDGQTAVNGDWMFSYRYPDDCLMARRILPSGAAGTGRQFDRHPVPFRVGRTTEFGPDDDYLLVFTNLSDAVLEYTALVECREDFNDALFEDALAWLLAAKFSPGLERAQKTAQDCYTMFLTVVNTARAVAQRESQLEPDGDASWTDGR